MKALIFLLKQTLLLGTVGFVAWMCVGWWHRGWFWARDTPQAWLLALGIVGVFLTLVATSTQFLLRSVSSSWALAAGALSGPLAVVLHLFVNTRVPVTLDNYVVRLAFMHIIFASLGAWFSFNYRRMFRPNNSSRPTPLRGAAYFRR
jgi:hypothetical protein